MLGGVLNGGIDGKQRFLGTEDLFDAGAEFRLGFGGEFEIGAQVEQGVLADLFAKPSGLDESVGEIRGTGAARSCLRLANEHEGKNGTVSESAHNKIKKCGTKQGV